MCGAFAVQKDQTTFSVKIIKAINSVSTVRQNESSLNDYVTLLMLWTTRAWCLETLYGYSFYQYV